MTDAELITAAGEALYGDEDWRRGLARRLGEVHPEGPRATMDPRTVGRWGSGEREAPDWVLPMLARLLRERAADASELARQIETTR